MSRSLRTLPFLTRPTLHIAAPSRSILRLQSSLARQREPYESQTVRFANPGIKSRRTLRTVTKTFLNLLFAYYFIQHFLLEDEEDTKHAKPKAEAEAESNQKGENEEVMGVPDEMPEDAVFIPLWFPKAKPEYFYKGSDPEWQSYAAFARDRERRNKVRQDVVNLVGRQIDSDKRLQRWLGAPLQSRPIWLVYDFPKKAPSEYERPGIEIAEEYVALTTRPLSERQYKRVKESLWPKSIATSFWVSYQTFWSLQYARIKESLNIKSDMAGQGHIPQPGSFTLGEIPKSGNQSGSPKDTGLDTITGPTPTEKKVSNTDPSKAATKPTITNSIDSSRILSSLPGMPKVTGDAAAAVQAFKQTLAKTWQPAVTLERGQIVLSGIVEVEGSRGVLNLEVLALYNPQRSALDSVSMSTRRAALKKQAPPSGA